MKSENRTRQQQVQARSVFRYENLTYEERLYLLLIGGAGNIETLAITRLQKKIEEMENAV
jgi:hypothetical protein